MTYTTREGVKMSSTLTLKVEGETVTGTISSPRGSIAIEEASVKGDDIAFAVIARGVRRPHPDRLHRQGQGRHDDAQDESGREEPLDVTAKRGG